jgi:hypothetical protein
MSVDGGEPQSSALDDQRLAEIAADLLDAMVDAIPAWVRRTVEARAAGSEIALDEPQRGRIAQVASDLAAALTPQLEQVLTADVDGGSGSPLAVVRSGTGTLNDLLDELGIPRPARDDFSVSRFPEDRHDIGPAAFVDIDESVHEPGIMWGAARAHVHLRRRREAEPS